MRLGNEVCRTVCAITVVLLAMLDVQNFFHKALAVIFAKAQHLYFRRKLLASSIEWYLFPVAHLMYAEIKVDAGIMRPRVLWVHIQTQCPFRGHACRCHYLPTFPLKHG